VNGRSVLLITPKQNIIYSSAEHFKVKVFFKVQKNPEIEIIVINGDGISFIDTTALDVSECFTHF
jgi:anti-anti-sigma regulatory factor